MKPLCEFLHFEFPSYYQCFTLSIALNTSSSLITRVSDDGMHITYCDNAEMLKWQSGL